MEDGKSTRVRKKQLLNEFKKRYHRVYLSEVEKSGPPSPDVFSELVLDEKAWLPFSGLDSGKEAIKKSGGLNDPFDFHSLVKDVVERNEKKNCLTPSTKGSWKITYKVFGKDCMHSMCALCHDEVENNGQFQCNKRSTG